MEYRWTVKPLPKIETINHLTEVLGVDKNIAVLLAQRSITNFEEAKHFFRPSLDDLHNPFLMKDMDKAVERIEQAINNNEKILIYGDYDVDGTTAVSLVYMFLKQTHSQIATYIPDRYTEGYGVSFQGIDYAKENGFSLIIALDCGIKAIDKIAYAKNNHIDFIVCDHHQPEDTLPDAVAVLNAKRSDCTYPFKELCGCGIGFKLIQAITQHKGGKLHDIISYLDLVAVATAADIVPMTGENRVLMYYGLKVLNENPSVGLSVLQKKQENKELTVTDVVFGVAPKINAAGRMEHGQFAVNLLTETNIAKAKKIADEIEIFNNERKITDEQITNEALQQIINNNEINNATSVVYNENWHKGVIGIVASRLIEHHYRPTLVFTKSGSKMAASARSVKDFDIYEALKQCTEHIEQFGGHKYAAGLTLLPENYTNFKNAFDAIVSQTLDKTLQTPQIHIDLALRLDDITEKMYRIIKQFEPFGPSNLTPIFYAKNVSDTGYATCVGKNNEHLKLTVKDHNGNHFFSGIGFGLGNKINIVSSGKPFAIAYSIDENHWNGKTSLQLKIRDIKPHF